VGTVLLLLAGHSGVCAAGANFETALLLLLLLLLCLSK